MTSHHSFRRTAAILLAAACVTLLGLLPAGAQRNVTTPREAFGFNIGDNYHLANYRQLVAYWTKLDRESGRLTLETIGQTEEGRAQVMAVVSSPSNIRRADRYREITRRLALAEGLTEEQARKLARDGRAIVLISGGLHGSETLGAQQLIETVYQLVSREDAETRRILDEVIFLAVLANPDGMDLVSDWYMREPVPEKRVAGNYPRLYQKYIGHDNNRDFYAVTQSETRNLCRVMFREWFPQIVYDHHQSGPAGSVMFAPPFRDPFNYRIDPRVIAGIDAAGSAMMTRFLAEGKTGVTVRSGARYSAWWNGGLRSITYFHNMIGLLTETIGSPTPVTIPFEPKMQLPRADLPAPIEPQSWPFRKSVDYSVTANYAVLDYAARHREHLLWTAYAIGRDAIAAGNRDSWTPSPQQLARAQEELQQRADAEKKNGKGQAETGGAKPASSKANTREDFRRFFRDPGERDPRGYIIPADQPDFGTAGRFINTLIENGVRVLCATNAFQLAGRTYPAGSYAVPCNQAFRAHVLDAFEPQRHPEDLQYPGGPPIAPYDIAGWTLSMQMGVKYDRVWEPVEGPFATLTNVVTRLAGSVVHKGAPGYFLRPDSNDAFRAINRAQAGGLTVQRLAVAATNSAGHFAAGTFYLPAGADSTPLLERIAAETGVTFIGGQPSAWDSLITLKRPRVGLWDRYGGSMSSGWMRWVLEEFEIPFEVVYAPALNEGNLRERFDALIFVTGAIPEKRAGSTASIHTSPAGLAQEARLKDEKLPLEYRGRQGSVTEQVTIPRLREFAQSGGVILTIGSSTALAGHFALPVMNHLVEKPAGGKTSRKPEPLSKTRFYIPGSIVRARVDTTHPLAWGMSEQADFMFVNSPVFRPSSPAVEAGDRAATVLTCVARFDEPEPLRSGWCLGQNFLQDGWAVLEAKVGDGQVVLYGPDIAFRGQSHGTFRLLFNPIVNSGAQRAERVVAGE